MKIKYSHFPTSALFDAIKTFVPVAPIGDAVLDTAFEISGKIYFARTISDQFCDDSSADAFNITTMTDRDSEQAVYLSPRRNSIFTGGLIDAVTLFREGYNVYPVEEYQHSDVAIRPVSRTPIRSARAIETGSFREGVSLACRFDSSFAFLAQPKSWPAPTTEFLREFSNWMNGYSYSYEILCATPGDLNDDGKTKFSIDVLDECRSYYGTANAETVALESLEACIKQLERVEG